MRLRRLEERVTPTNTFPAITVEFVSAQENRVTSRLVISNGSSTWTDLTDPDNPRPRPEPSIRRTGPGAFAKLSCAGRTQCRIFIGDSRNSKHG
jgi:hypothetical protein